MRTRSSSGVVNGLRERAGVQQFRVGSTTQARVEGVDRREFPRLELSYEGLDLPADPGWHLYTFTAAPGTPSDDRLRLLASWAATLEHENISSRTANADASEDA